MGVDALAEATKRPPKTARGKRILKKREGSIVEDAKSCLIIRGNKTSHDCTDLLRDLHVMRAPLAELYMRKHADHPFEDHSRLQGLCTKLDHGLFAFGSSSKKRPFRLILGRMFHKELLDMQEFGVKDYRSIRSFKSGANSEIVQGSKPLVLFQGTAFDSDDRMKRAKSLLLDYFSGPRPNKILLQGINEAIVCSTLDTPAGNASGAGGSSGSDAPTLTVRRYRIEKLKSGSKLPRCEIEEVGPRFTLSLDRTREPDKERWKQAIKVPKAAKRGVQKNVKTNEMGKREGRVHVGKQDVHQIHTVHHGLSKSKQLRAEQASKGSAGQKAM